ncbi:MAG: histidine phosphatase family protein [Nitrospinota bacterium]|nr:histidine phosphatase family protein [Nitrospinota bacterium]
MNYVFAVVITLIAQLMFTPVTSAGEITAYTMNDDWQACSTSGIQDSQKFDNCITYPESGMDFDSCENPPKVIYFSRHAENRFRDITGQNNDSEYILTSVGQKMAQHLAKAFESVPVKMIYTSHYTRTRQTACPLMRSKGLGRQVVCKTETKSERFLQGALCKAHGNEALLVIGHSDTVEEMLINLNVIGPLDGFEIKLGELYKVTFQGGKGRLEETPIRYWNCDPLGCHKDGALAVKLD